PSRRHHQRSPRQQRADRQSRRRAARNNEQLNKKLSTLCYNRKTKNVRIALRGMQTPMDSQLQTFLNDLYQQGAENDARLTDRRQKMLNLEPETARFLSFLVRSNKCTRILEIGTSNGYSTCW